MSAVRFEEKLGYCNVSDITVKKLYLSMLPRPTDKEYDQIKLSIETDGQERPVVVNQDMILIDGHTRLEICKELGKQVSYEKKFFEDNVAILRYMAIANLHRRNLLPYQKVILYDELYKIEITKGRQRSIFWNNFKKIFLNVFNRNF